MRATIRFAIIAIFFPVLVAAQAVSPPPRPLQLVGDHWTPYTPPTEFPEGATVHIIVRGDTLWDLAAANLGDPYLWPQIWERNPYILDSHWIYPGDPLVIDVAVVQPEPVEEDVTGPSTTVSEVAPIEDYEPEEEYDEEVPYPLGASSDVYCFARLFEDEGVFPFSVMSAERIEYQDHFSTGDVIYLDGGVEEGVRAGDRFFIYSRVRPLQHPVSDTRMGVIYSQVGQLKVLCAQEHTSIAEVSMACDPISIGDHLLPFEPVPVPLVVRPDPSDRCDAPNGKPTGYIVFNVDDIGNVGTENLVMIDLGVAEGLYPGQFATVFRDNPVTGMPRLVIGELGILTVHDGYSTAKITDGWAPINLSDRIELK
jgi:hypothetical protein